ncbi:MAG: diacylglycerol kinase family protein [Telluria sp.]
MISDTTPPGAQSPLLILLNAGSGHEATALQKDTIETVLTEAARPFTLFVVEDPSQLESMAERLAAQARDSGAILVAAGGDGTINTVAGKAIEAGCTFGVLPQGTFNYFGRAHGIPEDLSEAVHALLHAKVQPVQVGMVNQRIFLVNASIGLYPQILEEREADKAQFGRSRLVALLSMIKTALGAPQYLRIEMERDGKQQKMRTPMLFVGNNPLQIEQLGIVPLSSALDDGKLVAIAPRSVGRIGMIGLMVRGALGRLGDASNLVAFGFRSLAVKQVTLYGRRRRIKVAMDGEVTLLDTPLVFRVLEGQLLLLKPNAGSVGAQELTEVRQQNTG